MQAAAIGPYIYSDLTPPPLRQAAWSQLRPSYDPPAPGTDDADLPCCSAGDGEAMTVLPTKKSGSSDPTVGPYDSEKLWAATRERRGRGSPAPDRSVLQNPAIPGAPLHRSPPPAGPSPLHSSPRLSSFVSCRRAGPEPPQPHAGWTDAFIDSSCGGELECCWATKWAKEALGPAGYSSTENEAASYGSSAGARLPDARRCDGRLLRRCRRRQRLDG